MSSTAVWETVSDLYTEFLSAGDRRVTSWFLMQSPAPTFFVIGIYIIFAKIIGPALMKDRKPFELRTTMVIYNFGLVAIHLYFLNEGFRALLKTGKNLTCRKDDRNDPNELRIAEIGWWFYFFKLVELVDTVFFVLRKKFQHISSLHVIHHSIVPIAVWFGFRVEPASYNYFFPLTNAVVHLVMYTYYGLAALGPGVRKYLWWKKYLTTLQLVQFVLVFVYLIVLKAVDCRVSKYILYLNAFLAGLFLLLFLNFFQNAYLRTKTMEENITKTHSDPRKENGFISSEKVAAILSVADDSVSLKKRNT